MTGKLRLVFVLHNHQPVGNFDSVFETAFERAYAPYLEIARRHERFRFGLHISGPLLEWLDANRHEYIDALAEMVANGTVEMLGGAMYEAVLPMLSDGDRFAQLELMNERIERLFGVRPSVMWPAERVWEQSMVADLARAGIRGTLLDDHHFKVSGVAPEKLRGWFIAEDRGETMGVFPISEELRYLIPFAETPKIRQWFEAQAVKGGTVVYGDDGEKFGLWPHTHRTVYRKGWLEQFMTLLDQMESTVEMVLPSEELETLPASGRCYLSDCSYREMTEWALPTPLHRELITLNHLLKAFDLNESAAPFLKGANWRNFKVRYPEAANMYAFQVEASRVINAALKADPRDPELAAAYNELLRAQCDCAYWHGVFGGLYLPHLRDAVYAGLINAWAAGARKVVDEGVETGDFDLDGAADIRMSNDTMAVYIKPGKGGMVRALNILAAGVNLGNTLARHDEAYHSKVASAPIDPGGHDDEEEDKQAKSIHKAMPAKEEGLIRYIVHDWHERGLFQEHLIAADTTLEAFRFNRYRDLGDFTVEPWRIERISDDEVVLVRDGGIWSAAGRSDIRIQKAFHLISDILTVTYTVTNTGLAPVSIQMAVESNFGMSAPDSFMHFYASRDGQLGRFNMVASLKDRSAVTLCDDWRKFSIELHWDAPSELWLFPIYTVSQSESGFEKVFQSAVVMPLFKLELAPGEVMTREIQLGVSTW